MIVCSDFGCSDNGWKLDLNLRVQVFDLGYFGTTV